ncbi:phage tail tape measure protein [Clostridium sp. ZBS18]|uniref:phage tail tape measure protein n=2 Tax=unclassified Clostridium TaxID=2614128 RepID=UPI0020798209|nr:phage tail tape measure protein [Clostridium sp. ZBS18]
MADKEQLIVELGIKNNNVNKEISAINRELKNLDKEVKSTDKTTKQYGQTNDTLKSKLSNLEKMYTLNSKKLEDYKKKMESTTKSIKEQEEKIANMKLQGQDTAKAEEQLSRMKQTLSNVGHQATLTENEIKGLDSAIKETNNALKDTNVSTYKNKLQQLSTNCSNASETLKSVGSTASNVGGNILKATAPLVALGVASTKMATDFETSFAQVSTVLADDTDLKKYKDSVIKASDDTGVAVNNFSEAVYSSISASVEQGKAVKFTNDSIKLAKGGFTSASNAVDVLTTAINGYGLQAEDATKISDQLITTQNLGKTTVDQLASSVGAIIPVASNSNFSFSELSASMALMTKNGIATSESATYLKSMLSELSKSGTVADKALRELSGKGFSDLKAEGKSTTEILGMLDEYAKKNGKTLKDMFGSVEAGTGALTLARNEGKDYNEILKAMENSAGATQKAFDKMNSTPAEKMAKSINKAKNEMIRLGQNLLPMMDEVSGSIGKVADWLGKMTEEQQQAIIKATLFTTTFGGTVKVLGSFTNGLGSLVGGIGKVTTTLGDLSKASKVAKDVEGLATASKVASVGVTGLSTALIPIGAVLATAGAGIYAYNQYQDGLTNSCVTSREELGLLKSTLLELNGVHVQSQEELEKSGLVLKELGDNLGEDFKNKVNESTKSMQDFNFYLSSINMDNVLTDEETTGFNARVDNMCTTAIESIKSKQATSQEEMGKMFTLGDGVIDESEKKVLEYLNKNYNINIEEVTKLKNDINSIYAKAIEEKRALNENEIKDIQDKMSRIKQIELEALANNQEEQLFAKNEFTNRMNTLDAEGAKELLVQQKQKLDEQNAQVLASYDTQIEMMRTAKQKAIDAGNKQDADNLQVQIENKTQERDTLLEKQRETWQGYIDIAEEKNEELKGKINQYTGEILSDADLKAQQGLQFAKEHYDGLGIVTENGWYKVKDTTTGAMNDCYVTIDKNTGDITGCWNKTTGIVGGYTDEIKNKVKELGNEHEADRLKVQQAMGAISQSHLDAKNQVVGANGEVIGSFKNVTEAENGVKTGILDVNGTPMQIETNADGTITKMGQVKDSIDKIPENKEIHVKTFFEKVGDWFNSIGQNATGTNNYQGGLSTVHEKGFELASNNNVRMLGSFGGNPLAYIPRGTGIRTNMQSISDMKSEISRQLNNKGNVALVKALESLLKLQTNNNKNQIKENENNNKRHKENINYKKGILYEGKFLTKETIKEMHKIQKDTGGLKIDGKYYTNKALKLMEAKQYEDGHVVTKEEEKRMKTGLMIGQTYYDKETLKKMRVYTNNERGIWIEGKFVSDANVKEMQRNQVKKLKSIKLDGEYYNKNSKKSSELIDNYKIKNNKEIDYNKISENVGKQIGEIIKEILQGLGIEINVTNKLNSKEISNEVTDTVINKLGRIDRTSRVAKGR